MPIYDSNGDQILSAAFAMRSGEVKTVMIRIDCISGFQLSGVAVADIIVEARQGTSGAFTNIETTPLSLTPSIGPKQLFEIRLTAGTITAFERQAFALTVARA